MRIQRLVIEAGVAAVLLVGLQGFQALLLRNAIGQCTRLMMTRLEGSLSGVLTQAHKSKDDLLLFQVISAVAASPGVLQASIVDSNDTILAHRQPAKIGQRLEASARHASFYSLRDGGHTWGRLALSVSDRFSRHLVRRQWMIGTAAAAMVWLALFLYWQFLEKRVLDLRESLTAAEGLLQAEKRRAAAAEGREKAAEQKAIACLRASVQRIPEATLVLDAQQRLSVLNEAARFILDRKDEDNLTGKSWHEVPIIDLCGAGLERSLASPGEVVDWHDVDPERRIRFHTGRDGLSGTWVTLLAPSRVVQ